MTYNKTITKPKPKTFQTWEDTIADLAYVKPDYKEHFWSVLVKARNDTPARKVEIISNLMYHQPTWFTKHTVSKALERSLGV